MQAEQLLDIIAADIVRMGRIQAVKMHVETLIKWRKSYYLPDDSDILGDINALDALIEDVAFVFKYKPKQIVTPGRKRELVTIRKIITFIATCYKFATLTEIGKKLGGRDHTTVIHSNNTFRELYENNDEHMISYWNFYLKEGSETFTKKILYMTKDGQLPKHERYKVDKKVTRGNFTVYSNHSPFKIASELLNEKIV